VNTNVTNDSEKKTPIYGDKLTSDAMFQDSMKLGMLQHAHRILVYMLRRPDQDFSAKETEYLLRHARRINPKFVHQFYEHFTALVQALHRYLSLEESVTKSGAYRRDLTLAADRVKKIVGNFESEDNIGTVKYLRGLLTNMQD